MNSYVQLLCLLASFLYGVILFSFNEFNNKLLNGKGILEKFLINILYVFNISLVYVVFLYKINGGILHIYFILCIVLGYVFVSVKKRK